MTTSQTDKTAEQASYIPLWDERTEEFQNGWLTYRTADPYFVHLEIEDWPAPVVAPREILRDGLTGLAECLSRRDRTALRAQPSPDGKHTLLGITQGDLLLGVFRTPADLIAKHAASLYELVPEGEEMGRIDWDAMIDYLLTL